MKPAAGSFARQLKTRREAAGFTQEELATIAGISVHAVSALERGERRRPQMETVRALADALELGTSERDAFLATARPPQVAAVVDVPAEMDPLPAPPTTLVGREADLRILRHWTRDADVRLITLTGPGGVGKTRLCQELLRAMLTDGERISVASLASVPEAGRLAAAIAAALGLADLTGRDLVGRARAACRGAVVWLVLDNFEHLLSAAPVVAELIAGVNSLRVIVTSRAPLHVRGERQYAVGPLSLESSSLPSECRDEAAAPAIRLFVQRVRDVQPEFHLTATNCDTVAAICRRLDGLPLALELAAPWIKVLGTEGMLRRLERDGLLSSGGVRDLPERQQTMNATVAWSYRLLDGTEQDAFRRLAVLPGLFPIDAAAEVLSGAAPAVGHDQALAAVAALIDKSLLIKSPSSIVPTCPLYYMLETVRSYAGLELDRAGERNESIEGLVRYCAAESTLAASGLIGGDQVEWLDRVDEDLESYRAALGWLIESGRAAEALQIACSLLFFWTIRGHSAEGLRWYESIIDSGALPPHAKAKALVGAGVMQYTQGELVPAQRALESARTLATDAGVQETAAQASMFRGFVEHARGQVRAARDSLKACLRSRGTLGAWATGTAFCGLAWVELSTGDDRDAMRLLEEADQSLGAAGPWFLALSVYLRSLLAIRRGAAHEALTTLRGSLAQIRRLRDNFALVYALTGIIAAVSLTGDHAWVARLFGALHDTTERTGATVVDPMMRELSVRAEASAREVLGDARWAEMVAEGRRYSIDAVINDLDVAIA